MLGRACSSLAFALLGAYAASGLELYSENNADTGPPETLGTDRCLPCEALFLRLEEAPDGKLHQSSHIELRGEPKSGTKLSWFWANGLLTHTCEHLQDMYGLETCSIEYMDHDPAPAMRMVFEPGLARSDQICSCEGISRVEVYASPRQKHQFPVPESCPWKHGGGLEKVGRGCGSVNGRPVENAADLWLCVKETSCKYTDDSLQFVVMRDPRAVAVSTYFYINRSPIHLHHPSRGKSLDEAVLVILPQICQFTTIRHILFDGQLSSRSTIFWYEDAMRDPLDWYNRWASLAGFTLPASWIKDIHASLTEATENGRKREPHPGGQVVSSDRTWEDEVSPETREEMNSILRTWLPGVLLARFDVPA
ncbi:unnamed protein product [Ectocarpus sp. 8 AP-2014]